MTTETRREREKRALRQAILEAARNIAVKEGWEAVTIREIARAVEYGPPAIYALFENKEAILSELIRDGFAQMLTLVKEAYHRTNDPEQRLLAVSNAWWQFTDLCPQLYKVMNGLDGVRFKPETKPPEITEMISLASQALREAIPNKQFSAEELFQKVQVMRATLHGIIILTMAEKFPGGREQAKKLADQTMLDLLAAWRAQ